MAQSGVKNLDDYYSKLLQEVARLHPTKLILSMEVCPPQVGHHPLLGFEQLLTTDVELIHSGQVIELHQHPLILALPLPVRFLLRVHFQNHSHLSPSTQVVG